MSTPAADDETPWADTDEDTTPEQRAAGEHEGDDQPAPEGDQDDDEGDDEDDGSDTFPRPYVERLRARSAGYRARAKDAEARTGELERALFTERVRALDVLADPADLPFNADLLDDADGLRTAVAELVRSRPHYRRRGTTSSAGTGSREQAAGSSSVSLLGLMRNG